eukprot:CAMPEP_0175773324 /NCGR_PEP_ID=MMETSP0097-20121207/73023_1 /TAXON_ID=311494 /ORGANISM="Alexandrium monilatum, Strain CCMP3105" /LENGTH=33 /DNA_ID= /DNA_START= /DNA_END= /DNA_ORIENTATION=
MTWNNEPRCLASTPAGTAAAASPPPPTRPSMAA